MWEASPGTRLNRMRAVVAGETDTGPSPVATTSVTTAAAANRPKSRGMFGSLRLP